MRRAIIWFRKDLRLHDNQTLLEAIRHNDEIVPIYCLENPEVCPSATGLPTVGNHRRRFLIESLHSLDLGLQKLGSALLIVTGRPEHVIPKLAVKYQAQKVYTQRLYSYQDASKDDYVERELWKTHVLLNRYETGLLYEPVNLPFATKYIPDSFQNFRKRIAEDSVVGSLWPSPSCINSPELDVEVLVGSQGKAGPDDQISEGWPATGEPKFGLDWRGGEQHGLERLQAHATRARQGVRFGSDLQETGRGLATNLSPWISLGCLSPRMVYSQIEQSHLLAGGRVRHAELISALIRRDFYAYMMKKHAGRFSALINQVRYESISTHRDYDCFRRWIEGRTGIDNIDEKMIRLKLTGFLTNKERESVGRFLVRELELDWRWGAYYFERQLIDYDACSNWGNWMELSPRSGIKDFGASVNSG